MLYKREYIDNNKLLKEKIKGLKEANTDHKRLNGELRKEIELLQNNLESTNSKLSEVSKRCIKAIKYIRSNEWGIDYEHSNCRTNLLEILEGVVK